mmetsp:Transcript_42370/g.135700  ORF Transcript_42370/g.135700 Transcript_42370/m.135700 type:complete len:195 (-) Transcript_42370:29-613(-)
MLGIIIGKKGIMIQKIQNQSGASVHLDQDVEPPVVLVQGAEKDVVLASQMIDEILRSDIGMEAFQHEAPAAPPSGLKRRAVLKDKGPPAKKAKAGGANPGKAAGAKGVPVVSEEDKKKRAERFAGKGEADGTGAASPPVKPRGKVALGGGKGGKGKGGKAPVSKGAAPAFKVKSLAEVRAEKAAAAAAAAAAGK